MQRVGGDSIILVANPGSASRRYGIYKNDKCLFKIHFEFEGENIKVNYLNGGKLSQKAPIANMAFASSLLEQSISQAGVDLRPEQINKIALCIVAPSVKFQQDRILDRRALAELEKLESRAPLHINAVVQEANLLKRFFPNAEIIGISDSAFHATMPDVAANYPIASKYSQRFDIKRFGYYGISVQSVVESLKQAGKLPLRLIICHLGGGSSVTAVRAGKSIDTTMGYSPLEGVTMSTRSGTMDVTAAQVLLHELKLSDEKLQRLLNEDSGLLGISGESSDIRELLKLENSHETADLALQLYVYKIRQAIGSMTASLCGVDGLVFTGTVGERSAEIRKRIVNKLMYLGFTLDTNVNYKAFEPESLTLISPKKKPIKIYVVPADEYSVMARQAAKV